MITRTKINVLEAIKTASDQTALALGARIASQAKVLAPVEYGQLRNSISATSRKGENLLLNNMAGEEAPPLKTNGLKGGDVFVGTNVVHGPPQEFGTKHNKAQPYLRPAMEIEANGENVAEIMKKYGAEAMDRQPKERGPASG